MHIMDIDQRLLAETTARKLLDPQQADALRASLTARERDTPGLRPTHILYYSGGLLAIGAMSLFMNLGWQSLDGQGLLIIERALTMDVRSRRGHKDYAFWFYLFGTLALWIGLAGLYCIREAGYLASNLGMIAAGALLLRPVFVVFGGLGITTCLIHLAYRDYLFSLEFPFMLTLIGLATIGLGVLCQRHAPTLRKRLNALLPAALRELIEKRTH